MGNQFVTLKELEHRTGIKANTLYYWAMKGRIQYFKDGNRIYVENLDKERLLYKKTCPECGKVFHTIYSFQKFDERKCSARHTSRNWARKQAKKRKEARR